MNWFSKCSFNRPVVSNYPGAKYVTVYIEDFCPLSKCRAFTVKSYGEVVSFVVVLFLWCRPLHVVGDVSKVIVNTINGMFRRWFFANMFIECREVIKPKRENRYSASSVIRKLLTVRIATTILHALPCAIFRTVTLSCVNTTAAFCFPRTQTTSPAYCGFPAHTMAHPFGNSFLSVPLTVNNSEASKCLPSEINKVAWLHSKNDVKLLRKCQ